MLLLNGRILAQRILDDLKKPILQLSQPPCLAVMLVGSDQASHLYVRLKTQRAKEIGIQIQLKTFFATVTEKELLDTINNWNNDKNINGILVQLPLPSGIDTNKIVFAIDPNKDVDGFHCENTQKLADDDPAAFVPPVHSAVLELIRSTGLELNGRTATILGNSGIFTHPLQLLLKKHNITADIVLHPPADTANLKYDTDIVIIALGRPAWLKSSMIKDDSIIIDIGTNQLEDGPVVGDADVEDLTDKPGWLSPVPGGVGPLTIAFLLKNVVQATRIRLCG